jgi:hypothetical protein
VRDVIGLGSLIKKVNVYSALCCKCDVEVVKAASTQRLIKRTIVLGAWVFMGDLLS